MIENTEMRSLHIGSSVDKFFAEDGLLLEIEIVAIQRLFSPVQAAEISQESSRIDENISEAS